MTKLFVAFSHTLTNSQIEDANTSLGIQDLVLLKEENPDLQARLSQVDPATTKEGIVSLAEEVVAAAKGCSHFFMTGEPSVMFHANRIAMERGMVCVQSTTARETTESVQPDGSVKKTQVFRHVQWREL